MTVGVVGLGVGGCGPLTASSLDTHSTPLLQKNLFAPTCSPLWRTPLTSSRDSYAIWRSSFGSCFVVAVTVRRRRRAELLLHHIMGNFGATVASLLDTYTDCLSLLKRFRSNRNEAAASETRSTLSSSLRSDRARIRRAYSSRLSQNGARFEKGDGESCLCIFVKPHEPWI